MKKLLFIFSVTFVLAGCGLYTLPKPPVYYQYKEGEPNFHVAKAQCGSQSITAAASIQCPVVCTENRAPPIVAGSGGLAPSLQGLIYNTPAVCRQNPTCVAQKKSVLFSTFNSCLIESGWLPCSEGGLHLPECQ